LNIKSKLFKKQTDDIMIKNDLINEAIQKDLKSFKKSSSKSILSSKNSELQDFFDENPEVPRR
jgi:hypothetical protein